ncbi:MAG: hypothetical protein UY00_C0043G0009, partial [Candidatus Wolfebacteria bacterium GW2011_GWA1_47_6]
KNFFITLQAHNEPLQLLFELGLIGFALGLLDRGLQVVHVAGDGRPVNLDVDAARLLAERLQRIDEVEHLRSKRRVVGLQVGTADVEREELVADHLGLSEPQRNSEPRPRGRLEAAEGGELLLCQDRRQAIHLAGGEPLRVEHLVDAFARLAELRVLGRSRPPLAQPTVDVVGLVGIDRLEPGGIDLAEPPREVPAAVVPLGRGATESFVFCHVVTSPSARG